MFRPQFGLRMSWSSAVDTGAVCLRVFSSSATASGAAQFVHARFAFPAPGAGQLLDSAVVRLTIP